MESDDLLHVAYSMCLHRTITQCGKAGAARAVSGARWDQAATRGRFDMVGTRIRYGGDAEGPADDTALRRDSRA